MTVQSFGRGWSRDDRDQQYKIARRFTRLTRRYWWQSGWWGDQRQTSQCVGFAFAHWLEDGPVTHAGTAPVVTPLRIYRAAKQLDEWPGEDYDGTSVRAGAKALRDWGYIREFRWAWSLERVVNALLTQGPLVLGTDWTDDMLETDRRGFVHYSGQSYGGHAWVANGVNTTEQKVRGKNSWGRAWGRNGNFWVSFADLRKLLREDGEACLAVEIRTGF